MEFSKNFLIISLFVTLTSTTIAVDFCVADLNATVGPAGYPCKDPANLTADDFVFTGFRTQGNMANLFRFAATNAFDTTFPALNGLGLGMARLDIDVGGVVPVHSHRVSEAIVVVEGIIIAGFIATDNTAYYKTLNKGDMMIFPQMLLHFQVNVGITPAMAFVALNCASPGFETTSASLFANHLPTDVVHRITLLDAQVVTTMKGIFGGSN